MGQFQTVVFALLGTAALILCTTSIPSCFAGGLPKGLPSWFEELDTNHDQQISLREWRDGGKKLEDFRTFDLNDDGLITVQEVAPQGTNRIHLKLQKGRAFYTGTIDRATDQKYQGTRLAKIITVTLEAGKTYQIDHKSRAFDAFLYLEGPGGALLAQNDDGGGQLNSRIIHKASKTGTYRLIAASLGGNAVGPFSLTVRVLDGSAEGAQKKLPAWFKKLDTDHDDQVALREWQQGGKSIDDFHKLDANDDGLITAEEVLGTVTSGNQLHLENGQLSYQGNVDSANSEPYQGKRAYQILALHLQGGKTYQFQQVSQMYFSFLYLEGPDGKILGEHNSGGNGRTARIVQRLAASGTYRLIATSLGGFRTGPFSLSVRIVADSGRNLPKNLPPWFKELDTDHDGQITLREWQARGKKLADFHKLDLNDDGFVTPEEVVPRGNVPIHLKLKKGEATYTGFIDEAASQRYQGQKLASFVFVSLEAGRIYQIDLKSKAFDAYLYLESPKGTVLDLNDNGGDGLNSRIIHRAAETGTYRLVATSPSGNGSGPFSLSVRVREGPAGSAEKKLPPWFKTLDTDQNEQITLQEWQKGGKRLDDFRLYDRNDDGFITANEVLEAVQNESQLRLENGQAHYQGDLKDTTDELNGARISVKIFTIELQEGKAYQFEQTSRVMLAVVLQGPDNQFLARKDSGNKGQNARIIHRAAKTGTYRILVARLNGPKAGAFSLSVRVLTRVVGNLPAWFEALDRNHDFQISLQEWQQGGKRLAEFRQFDLNDDGFIIAEEVVPQSKGPVRLKLEKSQAVYTGAIDEAVDEKYRGQKLARQFTVKLEAGKTYQIDLSSRAFDSFLYLEGPRGGVLAQDDDGAGNLNARIVHQATETGTYRLIATSLSGRGSGPFSLAVRVPGASGVSATTDLPAWFKTLDTDHDGQLALREWQQGGKALAEFRRYDRNDDGLITRDEMLEYVQSQPKRPTRGPRPKQ